MGSISDRPTAILSTRCVLLAVVAIFLSASIGNSANSQDAAKPVAATDVHAKDRAAIHKAMQSFAQTFEARDAQALAGHWTSEGEYLHESGTLLQGREALEAAFAAFFEKTPEVTASVQSDSLRFLSANSAIDEGVVTVRRGPVEPAKVARYSALFVREGDDWRLAQLTESTLDEVSIEDLDWLVGEWQAELGEKAKLHTVYAWDPNKKFLHATFQRQQGELTLSGTQVIGIDPATGGIRTWTFEADGGVAEADWHRDGDHWVIDAVGTLTDGRTLMETNVVRRINDDLITWQSINRMSDDTDLPDQAPVKITRIKPAQ